MDWTGLVKYGLAHGVIKHGWVKHGVTKQGLIKHGVIKHGLIKHVVTKHGEIWINKIKYSRHKQMHDFLFCSLFRSSKLLILMNQFVNFSNIIFVLWCRSANNAIVRLKTTTTTKSSVKYRYSARVTLHNFLSADIKTNGPLSDPNGLVLEFFLLSSPFCRLVNTQRFTFFRHVPRVFGMPRHIPATGWL